MTKQMRTCTIEGCERKFVALGLCFAHYMPASAEVGRWTRLS